MGKTVKSYDASRRFGDPDNFFEWSQGVRLPQGATVDDDPNADVDLSNQEDLTDSIAREQWKVFESRDVEADFDYFTQSWF